MKTLTEAGDSNAGNYVIPQLNVHFWHPTLGRVCELDRIFDLVSECPKSWWNKDKDLTWKLTSVLKPNKQIQLKMYRGWVGMDRRNQDGGVYIDRHPKDHLLIYSKSVTHCYLTRTYRSIRIWWTLLQLGRFALVRFTLLAFIFNCVCIYSKITTSFLLWRK